MDERNQLLAEKSSIECMIESLPEDSVIDRMSLEARKLEVEKAINEVPVFFNEITKAHWKYIRELLRCHEISESIIRIVEFHYTTAFEHGWKHGVEYSEKKGIRRVRRAMCQNFDRRMKKKWEESERQRH